MVYGGLQGRTIVKFRDGVQIPLSKNNYGQFREHLYQKYLEDKGYHYSRDIKNRKVISTPDGFKVILPDSDYSWHFDELYETRVYGQPDLKGRIVIDIGAAIGDTALYFCGLGAERAYAFDPDKASAELARENVSLNGLEGRIIVCEQAATSDTIDDIIKSTTPDDRRFFLKVDCEGCEYELLRELLSKNSKSNRRSYTGVSFWSKQFGPNFGQVAGREKLLMNYLEKAGFDKPVVNNIYIIHAKRNVVSSIRTP
jgi:hypothetical protein